ncbi:hypothetical protein N7492_008108 [Penicillium capsulatum]|uniref:Uncharacterized protein n=1 Tax=Penicillium capsulatum TaxID=69766 RepID=A0A9W9LH14_9EURO|nr:hypothetical protein N7492_008108 [Penicillium capsulatum]KAJ6105518.1 hypothetical protein N7512_009035 [Penicillium capsulatum]
MLTSRTSRFFGLFKRRSKRNTRGSKTSSEEFHSAPTTPTSLIHPNNPVHPTDGEHPEDQRDGFYKYGESFAEDPLSLILPPYQSPQDNSPQQRDSGHFDMAPRRRHSRPHTVSSEEWVATTASYSSSPSQPAQVLSLHDLTDVQRAAHFGAVLKIFTKIFTIAKILHIAFLAYGVHLDHSQTGLLFWIKRAEAEIRTDSLSNLIEIVENLFYVLYSRLVLEMANMELAALFKMATRPSTTHLKFVLPDPNHLYRIFLAFKDVLDAPSMCEAPRSDLISYYQERYIHRVTTHEATREISLDDVLGFRRYAVNVVSERPSSYYDKWEHLIPCFDSIPANIMAILAEKYLTVVPNVVPDDDVPLSDLPFYHLKMTDPEAWERDIIMDHRIATLAKLQGRSIGDERRDDRRVRLLPLSKQQKCICASICTCARDCTYDVERFCPCAERQLRIMLARRRKDTGGSGFMTRANTLGRAFFHGLSSLKPEVESQCINNQIHIALDLFELEIQKERANLPAPVWTKLFPLTPLQWC